MKETSSQEEAARWRWPAVPCERSFPSLSASRERAGLRGACPALGDTGTGARPPLPGGDGSAGEK